MTKAPDNYDITIVRGTDWFWNLRWLRGKEKKTATPRPTPGYGTFFYLKRKPEDADVDAVLTLSVGDGATVSDDGVFSYHITHTLTGDLPLGIYWYIAWSVSDDPTPIRTPLASGRAKVTAG